MAIRPNCPQGDGVILMSRVSRPAKMPVGWLLSADYQARKASAVPLPKVHCFLHSAESTATEPTHAYPAARLSTHATRPLPEAVRDHYSGPKHQPID
jgi:hypothetical protein